QSSIKVLAEPSASPSFPAATPTAAEATQATQFWKMRAEPDAVADAFALPSLFAMAKRPAELKQPPTVRAVPLAVELPCEVGFVVLAVPPSQNSLVEPGPLLAIVPFSPAMSRAEAAPSPVVGKP